MIVAACQFNVAWENRRANFETVRALLQAAKLPRGSLAALPEMFATGYSMNLAVTCDEAGAGAAQTFVSDLARDLGIYILAGLTSRNARSGLGRNEAVCFDPSGQQVSRYCKLHPFPVAQEPAHYVAGESIETIAFPDAGAAGAGGVRVAPFICYDLRFPEVFREAALGGANLLAVIANWPADRQMHWLTLLRARAIENQAYVVGVNRIGNDPTLSYSGGSQIIDPRGQILADAGSREMVISVFVDAAESINYRHTFPSLRESRVNKRGLI